MPGPVLAPPPRRRWTIGLLYVGLIVNLIIAALLFSYVLVLKASRDTEQQRIEQRIDVNNCALLDQLPASAVLDRLRATYHCGPGLARQ